MTTLSLGRAKSAANTATQPAKWCPLACMQHVTLQNALTSINLTWLAKRTGSYITLPAWHSSEFVLFALMLQQERVAETPPMGMLRHSAI